MSRGAAAPRGKEKAPAKRRGLGAGSRTRTGDLRITNALLYQLSYFGNIYFLNAGANIICLFDI